MERFSSEDISRFKACLKKNRGPIILIPHINADGDAISSVFGLWKVLRNMGLDARVISPNSYANYYNWMCGHSETIVFAWKKEYATKLAEQASVLICMDFNQPSRAGEMEKLVENFQHTKILIDHHPYPSSFADILFSDTKRSSTAELTFVLLCEAGFQKYIDKDAASCFYAGIMTDTGSFNYSISDPETFQNISKLIEYGIDQDEIHSAIYDNFSEERMRLLGYCLNTRMKVLPQYHAAYMYLTKRRIRRNLISEKATAKDLLTFPCR